MTAGRPRLPRGRVRRSAGRPDRFAPGVTARGWPRRRPVLEAPPGLAAGRAGSAIAVNSVRPSSPWLRTHSASAAGDQFVAVAVVRVEPALGHAERPRQRFDRHAASPRPTFPDDGWPRRAEAWYPPRDGSRFMINTIASSRRCSSPSELFTKAWERVGSGGSLPGNGSALPYLIDDQEDHLPGDLVGLGRHRRLIRWDLSVESTRPGCSGPGGRRPRVIGRQGWPGAALLARVAEGEDQRLAVASFPTRSATAGAAGRCRAAARRLGSRRRWRGRDHRRR